MKHISSKALSTSQRSVKTHKATTNRYGVSRCSRRPAIAGRGGFCTHYLSRGTPVRQGVVASYPKPYDPIVSQFEEKIRARTRLALRAERAFGLNCLPQPKSSATAAEPPSPEAVKPAEIRQARPSAVAVPATPGQDLLPKQTAMIPSMLLQPLTAAPLETAEKVSRLKVLNRQVSICMQCRLCETRTQTVFGEGDPDAKVFFIGEGPGENEDLQGRPFVGRAGDLLNKWITAMGLRRDQVYIANIVKCRPPGNRVPMPDEVATCTPYLERQIEIIRPSVIVTLGLPALKYMMNDAKLTMGRSRGSWRAWRGIRLMPTFHPA